jgi:hypothetical protein
MIETYKIEEFPNLKEGEIKNLGYLTGITIVGDDPYQAKVHVHFERQGKKKILILGGDDQEWIISEFLKWFKIQLLNQVKNGTRDVKLIMEKVNGDVKIDMP